MTRSRIRIHAYWAFWCCLFCCISGFAAKQGEIEATIDRGQTWIMENPASSEDGGFLDMIDEVLFYLTIERLTSDGQQDVRYGQAAEDSVARLATSREFDQWLEKPNKTLIEHYHLLLATHLLEIAGRPTPGRDAVVEQAQGALAESDFENPTIRLTVALLLQHLGATPRIRVEGLLETSLINYVAALGASPWPGQSLGVPPFQHTFGYYALVHEVAALTDFGRLPASAWLMDRRSQVNRILQEGARRAMMTDCVDLLAELLLCNHMLDLPLTGELRAGVEFLVENQRADGTWGEQKTLRANRTRHAVQTATAALMAYKSMGLTR